MRGIHVSSAQCSAPNCNFVHDGPWQVSVHVLNPIHETYHFKTEDEALDFYKLKLAEIAGLVNWSVSYPRRRRGASEID